MSILPNCASISKRKYGSTGKTRIISNKILDYDTLIKVRLKRPKRIIKETNY